MAEVPRELVTIVARMCLEQRGGGDGAEQKRATAGKGGFHRGPESKRHSKFTSAQDSKGKRRASHRKKQNAVRSMADGVEIGSRPGTAPKP